MTMTKELRGKIFAKYEGHCTYCGKEIEYRDMQIDHLKARYLGGTDSEDNLMPASRACNFRKHTLSLEQFREEIQLQCDRMLDTFQGRMSLEYRLVERTGGKVKFYFEEKYSGHPGSKNTSVEEPAGTITTKDHHVFISAYYGNGGCHSVETPSPTVTTRDRLSLVSPERFIDMQYGNGTATSVDVPANTVTTNPKMNLVTVRRHYLMNPQYNNAGGSIEKPCFTLIARMDKMPPYLVTTETGETLIEVYSSDSTMTAKIKEFMALYGIVDIRMRMLKIPELKRIMGFPEDYVLVGTQSDQKKFIGNAVEVGMARALCEALSGTLKEYQKGKKTNAA